MRLGYPLSLVCTLQGEGNKKMPFLRLSDDVAGQWKRLFREVVTASSLADFTTCLENGTW